MELKYSPYTIFKKSKNPYALYARTKWMGESSSLLKSKIQRLTDTLLRSQSRNGSWSDSVVRTVENLYTLSLLSPGNRSVGQKAVDWLLEKDHPPIIYVSGDGSPYSGLFFKVQHDDVKSIYDRRDLPFTRGCSGFFKTGAALYFSGIFGRSDDKRVAAAFKSLDKVLVIRKGKWCNIPCSNNILRGYLSHPCKRDSAQSRKALKVLEEVQTETGGWRGTPFFYQTFNTVAQSNLPGARRQMRRAMDRVARSQNRDGTWGRSNVEFNTFMILDALHRQGVI